MKVEFTPKTPTPIKSSGIEIAVTNTPGKGGNLRGYLVVTNTKVVWRPSGVQLDEKTNQITWDKFIALMEGL